MIIDLDARREALDPERSFIVQAPAGSGKTGLLVYRYLTLLARVEHPQNVLAITFTRKARSEMRERILELLMAAQANHMSDDAFEQQGITLAMHVLRRDEQEGWQLLAAPHQMQILTIDAFSAKLAASMPWLSRLGERPNTTDAAEAHFMVAVEQVLSELLLHDSDLSSALQLVMLELDFSYDRARRLFSSMLAKRDQWLRHLVQQDMSQMRLTLEKAWSQLLRERLTATQALFSQSMLGELLELAVGAASRIDYENPRALHSLQTLIDFQGGVCDLQHSHWCALADFLLVKTGDKVRTAVNKNLGFPVKDENKERCSTLFNELRDDALLIDGLAELRELPVPKFSDYDWQRLVALEKVLKALAVRLQLRFRSTGECDHNEVTQRANMALAELNNPTDLGLLMDGQVHHILVDEFQDTSSSQLDLLKKLTAGWQLNDSPSRTLFLVGDPMQSIYRFREADVGLFLQVANNQQTQVFDNVVVHSLRLSQNFRSSCTLVDWFNTTFGHSFPRSDDVLSGAITYAKADSNKPASDVSPVSVCLANTREQEAEALLHAVEEALQQLPNEQSQIAILVRTRPQLDYLLPILDKNSIAYTAIDIQPLHEQQAIQDVVSLAKAICRDDDKLAWLALLRGPWCGISLDDIHRINRSSHGSIWQALNTGVLQQMVSSQALTLLRRFVGIMSATKAQYQQVDLGSLTRWAWYQLGGHETLGNTQIEDVDQLFDLLNDIQRGGDLPSQKELETALARVNACHAQRQQSKVVVSTIHKAKGLQYHTVILPGLANRPKSDDREILMWAEHQGLDGQTHLLLAPLLFDGLAGNTQHASHYGYLRRLDAQRANNEVMRLMYVACTRAEHRLVLLAHAKQKLKDGQASGEISGLMKTSLLASVWPAVESQFEFLPLSQIDECAQESLLDQTLFRLPADYQQEVEHDFVWQPLGQLNNTEPATKLHDVAFDWATEVATAVGILLHDYLQYIGSRVLTVNIDDALKKRWRVELLALRVPENRIEYALRRLVTAVRNIQTDDHAHFIFADHKIAQNEYAISTLENGVVKNYRLDRTFIDKDNVRWIVDYKSTTTQSDDVDQFIDSQIAERHRPQLEKYGELMSKLGTNSIKLAVYFPLLKQLRSWDYQPPGM